MKLLIITSEPLNPDNIISSTFELSQAKVLRDIAEVSILAVSGFDSMSAALKGLLISRYSKVGNNRLSRVLDIFCTLIFRRNKVKHYIIEEISVFEAKHHGYFSYTGFLKNANRWVHSGMGAYQKYEEKSGRPDIIHAHGRFLVAGALALEIKKRKGIPYIYTEHSTVYQFGVVPADAKSMLKEVIENASQVIAVSQGLLSALQGYTGQTIKHSRILPNVLDPVFESPLTLNSHSLDNCFVFVCIASLHPNKAIDALLIAFKDAFNKNFRIKLSIYGDGPLKEELKTLTSALNLTKSVTFEGYVSKEKIKEKLDNSNALVISSLQETFGVAAIEALARGCPVIATRCGGPEYILNENLGILIERSNHHQLTSALREITVRHKMFNKQELHEYAVAKFGGKAFLNACKELYEQVLNLALY